MILSLTVYTGTALLMAGLGWHVARREQRVLAQGGALLPAYTWEVVAMLMVYTLVSALRWNTTWDYNMYFTYYVSAQSLAQGSRESFEPLFKLVTELMARSGLHYACYFGFWAALQLALLCYALRRRKALLPWVALHIMLGPIYVWWMCFIRQAVVECLFVIMVELIVRRRFWAYLLLTLLATSVHKMSLLLLPLYVVPLLPTPRTQRRWLPLALLAACVLAGSFPQWMAWLFHQLGQLAQLAGYGHYYRLFTSDNPEYTFRYVMGPTRICPLLLGCAIVWHYPAIKRRFHAADPCLPALYRFALLYLGYANLMANTTQFLGRPGELMRATFIVMVAYVMHHLCTRRQWGQLAAMAVLTYYYIYYEVFKAVVTPGSIYAPELYHTFLLQ